MPFTCSHAINSAESRIGMIAIVWQRFHALAVEVAPNHRGLRIAVGQDCRKGGDARALDQVGVAVDARTRTRLRHAPRASRQPLISDQPIWRLISPGKLGPARVEGGCLPGSLQPPPSALVSRWLSE
jgi:hypothetical protein